MSNVEQHSYTVPIIILNWNGLEDTKECLTALFEMDDQNFKVYLLDNGSKSDVPALVELYEDHPQIELLLSDENLGFTKGNIHVLEHIIKTADYQWEYLALLNNDTAVGKSWLSSLLAEAKSKNAGMVASKMINYFDRSIMDNAGHMMLNTAEIVPIGHADKIENYNDPIDNFGSCAGATLYERSMIDEIGFFDPYFSTGYEDAEIGARALVSGYKCVYAPGAIVYHKISQSVSKIFDYDYLLHIQKNIFFSYLKLMPWPVILISLPSFIVKYLIIIIIDIIFWRPKYLKILFQTLWETFTKEFTTIRKKRKEFFAQIQPISSFQILRKQQFFLWFDTKRFFKYIVFRKQSEFDKVHNK